MTYSNKSYLLLCETLRSSREFKDKKTFKHHYINENKLLYYAISGTCKRIDFHALCDTQIDTLEKVIQLNIALLKNGFLYIERKAKCREFVSLERS